VLDNAQYHKAKELQSYMEEIKDRLELLFLPPYSPDLNPIETVWRETRRNVTHNKYFGSLTEQKEVLLRYWQMFQNSSEELKSLTAFIKTFIIKGMTFPLNIIRKNQDFLSQLLIELSQSMGKPILSILITQQ